MKITITHDDDCASPRDWESLGKMVCWHPNYNLGDEQPKGDPQDWYDENISEEDVVLSLYLYDHSGIMMSTSNESYPFNCPWDAGQVGWIFTTPLKMEKLGGDDMIKAEALKQLQGEVDIYNKYLQGSVWCYVVEDDDGEIIDCCAGFIGDTLEETGILECPEDVPRELIEVAWEVRT